MSHHTRLSVDDIYVLSHGNIYPFKADEGNPGPLEDALIKFYSCIRVNTKHGQDLPKRNTFDTYRSHIKSEILDRTTGRVDIDVSSIFKELNKFVEGYKKTLKAAGRGETDHAEGEFVQITAVRVTICYSVSFYNPR